MDQNSARFPYRRVAIIGCPGGGKSTLSRKLRDLTGLPLHHLDAIFWLPDGTSIPKEEFNQLQKALLETDEWIIDGNYRSTIEWRVAACDLLIFLDYPTEVCLSGVRTRRGKVRSDLPWLETEDDKEFLHYILHFETETKPGILEILKQYPDKAVLTFRSREEADVYLAELESGNK